MRSGIKNLRLLAEGLLHIDRYYDKKYVNSVGKINTLFVCAHPDDESLFFYSAIRTSENPFVLCLCGMFHPVRSVEFKTAMETYGIKGTMCRLPDCQEYLWMWRIFLPIILRKVKNDLNPDIVYTHNEVGEYGHRHHQIVNLCVHKIFPDCMIKTSDDVNETEEEREERRRFLSTVYVSQNLKNWFPEWY